MSSRLRCLFSSDRPVCPSVRSDVLLFAQLYAQPSGLLKQGWTSVFAAQRLYIFRHAPAAYHSKWAVTMPKMCNRCGSIRPQPARKSGGIIPKLKKKSLMHVVVFYELFTIGPLGIQGATSKYLLEFSCIWCILTLISYNFTERGSGNHHLNICWILYAFWCINLLDIYHSLRQKGVRSVTSRIFFYNPSCVLPRIFTNRHVFW